MKRKCQAAEDKFSSANVAYTSFWSGRSFKTSSARIGVASSPRRNRSKTQRTVSRFWDQVENSLFSTGRVSSALPKGRLQQSCLQIINGCSNSIALALWTSLGMLHGLIPTACVVHCKFAPRAQASRRHETYLVTGGATPTVMRLGTAISHLQDERCIYMDYNATTPVFPEVLRGCVCLCVLLQT